MPPKSSPAQARDRLWVAAKANYMGSIDMDETLLNVTGILLHRPRHTASVINRTSLATRNHRMNPTQNRHGAHAMTRLAGLGGCTTWITGTQSIPEAVKTDALNGRFCGSAKSSEL